MLALDIVVLVLLMLLLVSLGVLVHGTTDAAGVAVGVLGDRWLRGVCEVDLRAP